ncbi:MAG TPA: PilZ domain-containing protein [Bryobacteraceae bacterium]|nr:PilZ domain-containing protein [Bryobacteraceae bacterium]HPT28645.1 PilZ domain-containing protein [Bryobacteraceae bacterium]
MEQRKARRFELRLPVELTRAGVQRVSVPGETRNVSSGGVLFTNSDVPLEIGQPVEYFISLPTGAQIGGVRLRCMGKVVRHDKEIHSFAATLERYEFVRSSI